MKNLARWSIRNHVTVNLLLVFILVTGFLTLVKMRRELFPQFSLDMIYVSVVYPGSSPEEVEEGICIKIEEKIEGIEGISRMISTAREGSGSVLVELTPGADARKVLDEIKAQVDRIDTFPEEAEKPLVVEVLKEDPAVSIAVYGEASEKLLRRVAEEIRDDLLEARASPPGSAGGVSGLIDGLLSFMRLKAPERITQVDLVGVRNYEVAVEVSEENLRRFSLSFDQVSQALKTGSIDLPGGTIKTRQGEVLVRAKGQRYTGAEFEDLPLISLADGTRVRLGDVARVTDGFVDSDIKARFNGQPAAVVRVMRTSDQDVIEVSRIAKEYVQTRKDTLPEGIRLAVWGDLSAMVQDRIDLLLRNGTQGMIIVFIMLALFLNLRVAFWVAAGIPISLMGGFVVLDALGQTVNMISLFAYIMTLGILVDDATVFGENIFTHFSAGKPPEAAVVDGFDEVAVPVIHSVTTTIVAFIPLMFVAGIMGKFIAVMPIAVVTILAISLLEAMIILPSHLHHGLRFAGVGKSALLAQFERFRNRLERALGRFVARRYAPALAYTIRNRYFAFSLGIGAFVVSLALVVGGYVPFVFFPEGESDWIIAEVSFPLGSPLAATEDAIGRLEQSAFALNAEVPEFKARNGDLVRNAFSLVGVIPGRDWKPEEIGNHVGQVWIEIAPSELRKGLSTSFVLNRWRLLAGEIAGVEQLAFSTIEGGPAGNDIEIQLSGRDFDQLRLAAEELKAEIRTFPGTYDISDNFKPGKQEMKIRVKEGARSLGVSMRDLARQVRQAFYGDEALRIQRGRDDVKVMVRYEDRDRRSLAGVEEMRIRTAHGREVPIEEVAALQHGRSYSSINRVDRKRTITVVAAVDEARANASRIMADLKSHFLPGLLQRHPGLRFDLEGQEKRTQESLDSLKTGFTLALMGIFLILASQFRSYVQPLIIMAAIPFGLIGAVLGHGVMGIEITMISIFGIVALAGIVVNNALILIDFINLKVRSGISVLDAVLASGQQRFRAVMLTTITTIGGLLPLILERSFQAQFLIPMAVSISFGLLLATALTLLLVPALYVIVDDVIRFTGRARAGRSEEERPAGD
ncbi:MAG: efflux RND transporter permease subunit [Desulfobacterales bacterium]